jgi:hypothetical protein
MDPDPHWIRIQKFCESGLSKNAGSGLNQSVSTTLQVKRKHFLTKAVTVSKRQIWKVYEFIELMWLSLQFGRISGYQYPISGKSNPASGRIMRCIPRQQCAFLFYQAGALRRGFSQLTKSIGSPAVPGPHLSTIKCSNFVTGTYFHHP